jgi:succinate-semialdehyde dehydrogenase/glutarate-semialdehyde dehydrogenase
MTSEMGKTLRDGRAEVEKCALALEHFAAAAETYLAPEEVETGDGKALIVLRPLGCVLGVMPWNFPFWQVIRAAGPALMAGNGFVFKHASSVPGCALALEALLEDAGLPAGLFRTLLVASERIGDIIADRRIAAVTLTGSTDAGRSVAAAAGRSLKKCVLELGGSDPYVILSDADVDIAARICATARMNNGGQSCNAGKRFIVVRKQRAKFEAAFVQHLKAYAMGDPRRQGTLLGPMHSVAARDALHEQVARSVAAGAKVLLGGLVPPGPGAWYPATVLTGVRPGNPAFEEELFGPVAAIIEAAHEDDAIRLANLTPFGLGAGVITSNLARGEKIAIEKLDAGVACVNRPVRSDPRLPFGGVGDSGHGRECGSFGMREFVNVKTVQVAQHA